MLVQPEKQSKLSYTSATLYTGDLKSDHSKFEKFEIWTVCRSVFQMVPFLGRAIALAIAMVPTIPKINHFKSGHFWQPFFLMATISPDFKWLGFRISDAIPNLDHLIDHLKSVLAWISDPHCIQISFEYMLTHVRFG